MIEKIMIVDDSPMIHSMLRKTLESSGYVVCGDAKNGREAVEMFDEVCPDLIFMDITMPVMDGLEAAKLIKDKDTNQKIIMLTAMGDDEIIARAKEIGINIFLKKPFNEFKIVSAITSID